MFLSIGREFGLFLTMFAGCLASLVGRRSLKIHLQGQLSDTKNKNCEAIALKSDQFPKPYSVFSNQSSGMKSKCEIT